MPIRATEIKRGQALMYEGQLHVVLETEHVKPGKGPAYIQAKMKNLQTGTIKTNRLNSSDRFEDVSIDRRQLQYLYDAGGGQLSTALGVVPTVHPWSLQVRIERLPARKVLAPGKRHHNRVAAIR